METVGRRVKPNTQPPFTMRVLIVYAPFLRPPVAPIFQGGEPVRSNCGATPFIGPHRLREGTPSHLKHSIPTAAPWRPNPSNPSNRYPQTTQTTIYLLFFFFFCNCCCPELLPRCNPGCSSFPKSPVPPDTPVSDEKEDPFLPFPPFPAPFEPLANGCPASADMLLETTVLTSPLKASA